MEVLYHYTSLKCYEGIRQTSLVKQSIIPGRKDGVYLTKLDPWTFTKQQLIMNNYRAFNDYKIERVECYVKIWLPKSQLHLIEKEDTVDGRDIWLYWGRDLDLNCVPHEYGLVASETVSRIWQQLEQKNQHLEQKNEQGTHKIQQLEQENKQMKHQIKHLEQEISQTQELEQKNKHLELENQQVTHKKQQIEQENKQLKHQNKHLEQKIIHTQKLEQENKQQGQTNQQLSQENQEIITRNKLLKQQDQRIEMINIVIRKINNGNISYVAVPFHPSDTINIFKLRIQEKKKRTIGSTNTYLWRKAARKQKQRGRLQHSKAQHHYSSNCANEGKSNIYQI